MEPTIEECMHLMFQEVFDDEARDGILLSPMFFLQSSREHEQLRL